MTRALLKIINASGWHSLIEGSVTLFSVPMPPVSVVPIDCHTPSAFAWVLVDEHQQTITAARDYLGLEPFYYCFHDQTCVFGSTIPDVIKQLPKRPELNVNRLLEECFHDGKAVMTRYSNETHYQGIFRLEAGSRLSIKNHQLTQEKYWTFDRGGATLNYADEQEYIDHLGELLSHAVLSQIQPHHKLAAEYSGGLDSTAVLSVCHQHRIELPLFCHVAGPGQEGGDFSFADCVIAHFNCKSVHYVDAQTVDLATVFQSLAQLYAGAPPYIYPVMSNNVYQRIQQEGCNRILSGFGGDQCVSVQAGGRPFFFELLQHRGYQQAWREYTATYPQRHRVQAFVDLLRYQSPALHAALSKLGDVKHLLRSYLDSAAVERRPRFPQHYDSVRELQVDLLEGALCHEVRTRVEYSALLGKAMGFSHVYPLLHPAVVDFALRVPCEFKKRHGQTRYLMRRYLAQHVPAKNYTQRKRDGAHIMPAMMEKCRAYVKTGQLDPFIRQLPFAKHIKPAGSLHGQVRHAIFACMINAYLNF